MRVLTKEAFEDTLFLNQFRIMFRIAIQPFTLTNTLKRFLKLFPELDFLF